MLNKWLHLFSLKIQVAIKAHEFLSRSYECRVLAQATYDTAMTQLISQLSLEQAETAQQYPQGLN